MVSGEIKENLILNEVPETTEFTFDYQVKNLKAKLEDNKVIFYNEENSSDKQFVINAPYMYDAAGEESTDITLKLQDDGDSYKVVLSPNKEWLQSPDRKYPVVIDPTVVTSIDPKDIADAHVSQSYPTTNYQVSDMLKVGKGSTSGINQTFIKFTKLPTISSANVITSATLDLSLYSDNTAGSQVNIHKVTKDWSSDSVTWNTKPTFDSTKIQDYQNINGTAGDDFVWDITNIAKQWYTDQQNYGLMLKADDETANYTEFYSSDVASTYALFRPVATFDYVNNSGLEDYWTYHSQDVGRAGTGYVNDYSGNLVFTHDDLDMDGIRMPVSISHVFNSNDRLTDTKYGYGWRLNLNQRVDLDSTLNQYYYTDEDGTKHYFDFDSANNIYNDESGLDITMTIDSASTTERYKIKDKGGDQLSFNSSGNLTYIKDNNTNTITLGYSGNYLISATDGAGRVTTLKRDPVTNNLTQIIDPSGRITSYEYTGSNLTKITYPDGKSSSYIYDANHNLTEAKNFDGYRIDYTYYPNSPYRVLKSTESNIDSNQVVTNGQSLQFTYGKNTTSFVDNLGRKEIYQFNDSGNTVSAKDPDGNAEYYKYNTSGANVNKLSAASKLQKTTINYLLNHNAEKTTDWTQGNDSGSTGSQSFATDDDYIGYQSLKVIKTNNVNAHYYNQTVTLTPGKTYTYSGYVKTSNVTNTNNGGAALYLTYQDKAGTYHTVTSSYVSGTNDWDRTELNFTLPSDTTYKNVNIRVGIVNETGTAYFDALQLEDGKVPSRYNLVENPDLTYGTTTPTYWSTTGSASLFNYTTQSGGPSNFSSKVMGITGDPTQNLNMYQVIEVSGKKGDALTVGGWGKGDSVPITYPRYFAVDLGIKRTDGTYQWFTAYFNEDSSDWQYTSGVAIADSDFTEVKVYGLYYKNENKAYFDGFQLYLEPFEDNYSYDSNGNITSSKNTKSEKSSYTYSSSNDLTEYEDAKGNSTSYNYDSKHNLLSVSSPKDIISSFTYDSYGNATGTSIKNSDGSLSVDESTTYTTDGNYVSKVTDASGNDSNFNYDLKNGNLKEFTDPNNNKTTYTYDLNTDNLQSVSKTVDQQTITNSYEFENDELSKITANGTSFGFKYDVFGNDTETTVGSKSIVSNIYDNTTHLQQSTQYNQGDKIYFGYDNTDRVTYKSLNKSPKADPNITPNFSYDYDNNGNLALLTDNDNSVLYRYYYDILDRLTKVKDSFGNYFKYSYDSNDNVTKHQFGTANNLYTTTYSYDKDDKQTSISYNQPYVNDSRIETFFSNGSTTSSNETRPLTNNATFSQEPDRGTVLSAYEGTTNLIPSNQSFETGTTGWTITDWSALSGGGRISQDSTDGSQSLEFYDKNKQANPTNAVAYETFTYTSPITAAKTVTFSAMAKRIGGTNPTLSIRCYDSTGTDIPGGYVSVNQPISSNEWTKISQVFTVPTNTKSFKILLRGTPKGSDLVRFDQVQLEEKSFATPYTDSTSTGTKLQYNLGLSSSAGTLGVWYNTKSTNTNRTILANEKTGAGIANLSIGTDNKVALTIKNNAGTNVTYKSTAPVIAVNTWNLTTLHWTKSGSTITFKLGVNGTENTFTVSDWKDFSGATTSVGSSSTGTQQLNGDISLMTVSPVDLDVSSWSSNSGSKINFTYDSLGRIEKRVINLANSDYTTTLTYKQGESSGKTTYLIDTLTNGDNPSISYTYDKLGNVKTITENGKIITYTYNEISEILREDNEVNGQTAVFTYDVGGNITTKNIYEYTNPAQTPVNPTKTIIYHYDDSNWHDLLTSTDVTTYSDGTPSMVSRQIMYDSNAIGNPTSYDQNTLTWTWGDELKYFSNLNYDVTYSYNDDGVRTKKVVKNKQNNSTVTTNFILDGDDIEYESDGTNTLHYTYDSDGRLLSFNLNGEEYYYIINAQTDVIGLLDESGNLVVSYQYDVWGNQTSISGPLKDTVGTINPYRYRGYRYDTETNLYYLQSRYYNPDWGRFISEDSLGGTPGELLSHNQFAYVLNNPVSYIDFDGYSAQNIEFGSTPVGGGIRMSDSEGYGGGSSTKSQKGRVKVKGTTKGKSSYKGKISKVTVNKSKVMKSARAPKKGGESKVGHALQKHAGRHPETWGKVKGNSEQINKAGEKHLSEILDAPGKFKKVTSKGNTFLEKRLPDGRGVRLNLDGTFKGFID